MKMSVASLRQNGYKVRVNHYRPYEYGEEGVLYTRFMASVMSSYPNLGGPKPRGGETRIEITTPNGETLNGVARCSDKDSFNRKLGVSIALGRAFNGADRE